MSDREIGAMVNGIVKVAMPTNSGEVLDINHGGLPGGNVGDPVNPTDIVNKQWHEANPGNPFDQSLNSFDGPTFAGLTSTAGLVIFGPMTKSNVIANHDAEFKFTPDDQVPPNGTGTRNITDSYLGTFDVASGTVDITISDLGNDHGSSSFIRISRHFDRTPYVHIKQTGIQFSTYIFYFRSVSQTSFELFFIDTSKQVNEITYEYRVLQQGTLVSTTNSNPTDDTGIELCLQGLCSYGSGETQICGSFNFLPKIIETADFDTLVYTVVPGDYWLVINSFPVGGKIQLPNATITTVDGRNFLFHVSAGTISTLNPIEILPDASETINGGASFLMTKKDQTLDTGFVFSQNDHKINSDYPADGATVSTINSPQDMFDKYELVGTDIIIPTAIDLNPTTFIDLTGFSIRPANFASIGILGYGSNNSGFTTSTPGASNIPLINMPDQSEMRISDCKLSATGTTGEILVQNHPFSLFQVLNNVELTIGNLTVDNFGLFAITSCFLKASRVIWTTTPTGSGVVRISQTNANPRNTLAFVNLKVNTGVTIPEMSLINYGGLALNAGIPGNGQFLELEGSAVVTIGQMTNCTLKTTATSGLVGLDEATDQWRFVNVVDDSGTPKIRNSIDNITQSASSSGTTIMTTAGGDVDISDGAVTLTYLVIGVREKFIQTPLGDEDNEFEYTGNTGHTYVFSANITFLRGGGSTFDVEFFFTRNGTEISGTVIESAAVQTKNICPILSPEVELTNGDTIQLKCRTVGIESLDVFFVNVYAKRG